MEYVTIINRSSKKLEGTWDGRHYELTPGKHEFPRLMAEKFRAQNPIMGTEDKYTGNKKYLIGIVQDNDPIDPVEQSNSISLEDLSSKIKSGELKVVQGEGLYSWQDRAANTPLPSDSGFVKP